MAVVPPQERSAAAGIVVWPERQRSVGPFCGGIMLLGQR